MRQYDSSFHAYIQGIILIGFALLILWLILSGNIIYYIAPKMMPFVYFALATFFILGIVQIFRSTKNDDHEHGEACGCGHDHKIPGPPLVKLAIYSVFSLPILLGFILPDRALDGEMAANRGIMYGGGQAQAVSTPENSETAYEVDDSAEINENEGSLADAYLEDPEGYMENLEKEISGQQKGEPEDVDEHYTVEDIYDQDAFDQYFVELAKKLEHEDVITVTEENYLDIMTVMDIHLDTFVGKEIEIIGFAYREPDFDDHQLVAARFSMTCCAADAGVYGTLIDSNEAAQIEDDSWFHAYGTIDADKYNGQRLPVIHNAELTEVEEPDSPYVYPSF